MSNQNPKQALIDIYNNSLDISDIEESLSDEADAIRIVLDRAPSNKGVYTVLVTLALYKVLNPDQDIRAHMKDLPGGFSGRGFDTKYVTPTMKELKLISMAESGWLTRSLEQNSPYDMNFNGNITPLSLKNAFLRLVQSAQSGSDTAEKILRALLNGGIEFRENNKISIQRIDVSDAQISKIIELLHRTFTFNYEVHGGSKLPAIAFYAMYSFLIPEMKRFEGCVLLPMGSHTAPDGNSKSAGDVEVKRGNDIFEAIEIKLDKQFNAHMVRVAFEKINKFRVSRYYLLSGVSPDNQDIPEIEAVVEEIERDHGCQVIVNGFYSTLSYYLRLIAKPVDFLNAYVDLVEKDDELQLIHKQILSEIMSELFPDS